MELVIFNHLKHIFYIMHNQPVFALYILLNIYIIATYFDKLHKNIDLSSSRFSPHFLLKSPHFTCFSSPHTPQNPSQTAPPPQSCSPVSQTPQPQKSCRSQYVRSRQRKPVSKILRREYLCLSCRPCECCCRMRS